MMQDYEAKIGDRVLTPYGEGVVHSFEQHGGVLVAHDTLVYGGPTPKTPVENLVFYRLDELRPKPES
jgi:hypothetical protein